MEHTRSDERGGMYGAMHQNLANVQFRKAALQMSNAVGKTTG